MPGMLFSTLNATLFFCSLVGGFCSGLLGVGGAVILIPLLLTVPPLFGVGALSMHAVAGITMIQVLGASAFGAVLHARNGYSHRPTMLAFGLPMGALAFAGAAVSRHLSDRVLEGLFVCIVVAALILLVKPASGRPGDDRDTPVNRYAAAISGGVVGFISGMVGAGGGFILVPVMTGLLGISMKVAVGSSLGILFIGSLMGATGKIVTGQVDWGCVLPVIIGALPSTLAGSQLSKRLPAATLRGLLIGLLVMILIKGAAGFSG